MLLQFQQVQLELYSTALFKLDGPGDTLHLDLEEEITCIFLQTLASNASLISSEFMVSQKQVSRETSRKISTRRQSSAT